MPPPREYHPRATLISALVVGALIAWSYWHRPASEIVDPDIRGTTMGEIPVMVRLAGVRFTENEFAAVQAAISGALDDVNRRLSTYREDSEISAVNVAPPGQSVPVSEVFATVYRRAVHWHRETEGAFDPGMDPLMAAYGFFHDPHSEDFEPVDLDAAREAAGLRHFTLHDDGTITRTHPHARLNFSAIAKGYAVDRVMDALAARGITRAMVEVGGEVKAAGTNPADTAWRIGIEQPEPGVLPGTLAEGTKPVALMDAAMAGSGGYRQFRVDASGRPIAHILDPRRQGPVTHHTVAVHVIADTCMDADAVATALYVMGVEEGLTWVAARPGLEALFITRDAAGFAVRHSSGFPGQADAPVGN